MIDFLGQLSNKTSCFDDFWMVPTCTLDRVGSKLFMFQASLQDDAWVFILISWVLKKVSL